LGSGQVLIEAKIRLRATHPRWQGSILASPPEGTESVLLDYTRGEKFLVDRIL
jgi:hypothetical protein